MKLVAIITLLLLQFTPSCAFVATPSASPRLAPSRRIITSSFRLHGTPTRPDATQAVKEAMEATQKYGPTSKQARVAWDIVEEMDSSDLSPAISTVVSDPQQQQQQVAKMDYYNQVHFLAILLKDTTETLQQMKQLVASLFSLEEQDPSLALLQKDESSLTRAALQEAKAAMEVHGAGSKEAMEAWNFLEKCMNEDEQEKECNVVETQYRYSAASLKAHHYYNAVMDTSLLREAMDAFDTIQVLQNYVQVEKNRLDKMSKHTVDY